MSFNPAITAAGPRLNADVFFEPSIEPPPTDPGHTPVTDPRLAASLHHGRFDAVALNPQPLPPRDGNAAFHPASQIANDDWCGTVPRKPPHNPPPLSPWADRLGLTLSHQVISALGGGALGTKL